MGSRATATVLRSADQPPRRDDCSPLCVCSPCASSPMSAPPEAGSAAPSASSSSSPAAAEPAVAFYSGHLVNGQAHGRGKITDTDGSTYEGEWKEGKRHGHGLWKAVDGERAYEGQWAADQRHGLGASFELHGDDYCHVICARWKDGEYEEDCAISLQCISTDVLSRFVSEAAVEAKRDHPNNSALLPNSSHSVDDEIGAYYVGELNEQRQPHGQGTSFHPDGSSCVTLLTDPTDANTTGLWVNGKIQGKATMLYSSGDRYDGPFKDGLRDGFGVYIFENGNHYEGTFKGGAYHGLGVSTWPDGTRYEGEWMANDRCGLGMMWDKDGKLDQRGRWLDDKLVYTCAVPLRSIPEGKHLSFAAQQAKRNHLNNSALLPDGTHYIGELNADGQPHGQGASFNSDGSSRVTLLVDSGDADQSGRWINGKLEGRATAFFQSGHRYDGLFKDDLFDGLGVYSCNDGRRYEGEFSADKRSGLGAQWNKKGKLYKCGRWAQNQLVESCAVPLRVLPEKRWLSAYAKTASLLYSDGSYYVGVINAVTNQPDGGFGQMIPAQGDLLSDGTWSNYQLQSTASGSINAQVAPITVSSASAATSSSSSPSSMLQLSRANCKALLIGNGEYAAPVNSLGCCSNDAEDMRSALTQLGFQCTLLRNAEKKEMTRALRNFLASLKRGDIVFLYYSGHGEESAGITYLLPSDFADGTLRDDAVSLNHIMADFNGKNCDLINIIVLDCCRANEHDATWKGGAQVIARSNVATRAGDEQFVRAPSSGQFFIAYSSDPGTVAFETKGGRNGWFTGCLLDHLLIPGLHIEQIFKRANAALELKSKQKQRAWHSSSLKDDVILMPNNQAWNL